MYPLWRCSGCEMSLLPVCFQLQSDGTASVTDKVPVALTHRRGRIAYTKICLPSRVWSSRSTRACKITLAGLEHIKGSNPEPGKRGLLLPSIHPSILFCDTFWYNCEYNKIALNLWKDFCRVFWLR